MKYFLRPIEHLGAEVIINEENSYPIVINDVRAGDLIRSKGKKNNAHHAMLIFDVESDKNSNVKLIRYVHSSPYYDQDNGVKFGEIKIVDQNKPLKDQDWLEKDRYGVNHTYEGFLVNNDDNGLRRLRCLEKIL